MPSRVLKCTCDHAGQDRLHGRQRRVHNQKKDSDIYKCTICGNERGLSEPTFYTTKADIKRPKFKKGKKGK